ncbi:MAG TPA: LysE family translocator [Gammaproteobacteria bacterium]|jgi:threonine/homoserine/homoserine lactone efflux protein|nr:LysE family translocator [Gammaproteobacteria bacterium]
MDLSTFSIIVFTTWLFAVTPGPGVMALISISTSRGIIPCMFFSFGAVLGDLVYLSLVILSLGALAEQISPILSVVRVFGAAYLIYLGYSQWNYGSIIVDKEVVSGPSSREVFTGFIVSVTNPKVMIFYLSILPIMVELEKFSLFYNIQIVFAVVLGVISALIIWSLLGSSLRKLINSPRAGERVNKVAGILMFMVGISLFFL